MFKYFVENLIKISDYFYLIISFILLCIAILLIGDAIYEVYRALVIGEYISTQLLNSVSLIVISTAIFDVGKYLLEEEISRDKELRSPKEARMTLTKFIVIIFIAMSLESLVYVFLAGKGDLADMVYPAILMFVSILLIIGLAIYQKLSLEVENSTKSK